ncbi:MAG: PBP1A family penicillin-binding protein [Actinomycetota bacterium]|nr:PBP1A family penicillin-binding protein [Actinomycetota bacterium]
MHNRLRFRFRFQVVAIAVLLAVGLTLPLSTVAAANVLISGGDSGLPPPVATSQAQTTQIFAADGSLLAEWHGEVDRKPVPLNKISRFAQQAVVASEDARFFERGAADFLAILRALWVNMQHGAFVQGGSTISQQYAKDAYVGRERTLARKWEEVKVARQLERRLGKEKVLERYLNTVYFGSGAYGVEAASQTYFQKPASDLNLSEAALLIGLIPAPVTYSPFTSPQRAEQRRLWVINRMQEVGYLTPEQAANARDTRPEVVASAKHPPRYSWFLDAVHRYLVHKYGSKKVFSGGLKVYTTIDPQAQEGAEDYLKKALPGPSDPHGALVSIDPQTGYVKAIVGGRDYARERFNIALQGRRQPGSSFKPFVLVAALEKGISPGAGYRAPGTICLKGWLPKCRVTNFDGRGYGGMTLRNATVHSVNTVYAQLVMQVGSKRVVDVAKRMGIPGPKWLPGRSGCKPATSDECRTQIDAVPALALGAEEVTPLEMASAYATLASGGIYREPKVVEKVVDGSGKVLEEGPSPAKKALEPSVAENATRILEEVISKGTGRRADIGRPAAGKTGTAQGHRNAWFTGYTQDVATAVWVGYRESNRSMVNVRGVRRVTGGTIPAEIWREYMKIASDQRPPTSALDDGLADGTITNLSSPVFKGTAIDEDGVVQRVEVSVNGGPFGESGVSCSGCPGRQVEWAFSPPTPLEDGPHTLTIRAVDLAGHRGPGVTRKILVDTAAPTLAGIDARGGASAVKVHLTEPVRCTDLRSSAFVARVGGRSNPVRAASCTGGTSPTLDLALGSAVRGGDRVEIQVAGSSRRRLTDLAGNQVVAASRNATATNVGPALLVGGTLYRSLPQTPVPPAAAMLGGSAAPVRPDAVAIGGSAADPDGTIERVEASIDGAAFSATGVRCDRCGRSSQVSWSYKAPYPLSDGPHAVEFRSVDNAGVASAPQSQRVVIDAVAPRLEQVSLTGATGTIVATFSEPVSCSTVRTSALRVATGGRQARLASVACGGASDNTIELMLAKPATGGETVEVSANPSRRRSGQLTDLAGNPLAASTASSQAQNSSPSVVVSSSGSVVTSNRAPTVTGHAFDPDGAVERLEVSVDGGPFTTNGLTCRGCGRPGAASFTYRPPNGFPDSHRSIEIRAVDRMGATSTAEKFSLTVDQETPTIRSLRSEAGSPYATLEFNEPIRCESVRARHFKARVPGEDITVLAAICQGTSAESIELRLGRALEENEVLTIQTTGDLTDDAGNAAKAGTATTITASP